MFGEKHLKELGLTIEDNTNYWINKNISRAKIQV